MNFSTIIFIICKKTIIFIYISLGWEYVGSDNALDQVLYVCLSQLKYKN